MSGFVPHLLHALAARISALGALLQTILGGVVVFENRFRNSLSALRVGLPSLDGKNSPCRTAISFIRSSFRKHCVVTLNNIEKRVLVKSLRRPPKQAWGFIKNRGCA